jgi:hypothetical protein
MSLWKVDIAVERGYDPDVDFFTSETGYRDYYLFGMKVLSKKINTKTKSNIIKKPDSKKKSSVGFDLKK